MTERGRELPWPSRPGPGNPRSMGSDGIGTWTMVSQARKLSFGRIRSITLKLCAFLQTLGFGYVIRFRGNIRVTDADGQS